MAEDERPERGRRAHGAESGGGDRGRRELRLDPEDRRPPLSEPDEPRPRPRKEPTLGRTDEGRARNGQPAAKAPPRRGAPSRPSLRRRLGFALLRWTVVFTIWGAVAAGAVIGYFALTLPETSDLGSAERRPSITLVAADGSLLATYGDLFGDVLRLNEMPKYVPEAVIATEDRRFYSHFGIDPIGLARAAFTDLRAGHIVQGGSTLTQQLAKNLFLTPDRTWKRKIQEMLLAVWLEHKFTKDQLLEIYLNRVYLGAGTYGIDAAAHRYFGKSARHLTLYESAIIAGLLKAPTRFSPAHDPERAAARAAQVLANMVDAGFITADQATAAERQSSQLAFVTPIEAGSRYFADWVVEQLGDIGGIANRDVTVVTTFDPRMQAEAEAAVAQTLARDGTKRAASQAALVAMAPDGAVRALVGGRDYSRSQFDRATQALRQPGSAFKPFVYLAGLEAGMRPSDHIVDGPINIAGWQPRDFERRYEGSISLAQALAQSINTVAVEVEMRAGLPRVIAAAHRLGITANLGKDASLALGTSEVTLLELTAAYGSFQTGGMGVWPYGISEIKDRQGNLIYRRTGSGPGRVIAPEIAEEMNEMLAGVMVGRGTGHAAALDRPSAGKTGTTSDFRDALFVGYTADLICGVWFGNDNHSPMNKVTGSSLPAMTWHNFMMAANKGFPPRPLPGLQIAPPPPPPAASEPVVAGAPGWIEALFGGGRRHGPAPVIQMPPPDKP